MLNINVEDAARTATIALSPPLVGIQRIYDTTLLTRARRLLWPLDVTHVGAEPALRAMLPSRRRLWR